MTRRRHDAKAEPAELHVRFHECIWRDGEWHVVEPKPPPDPSAFVRLEEEEANGAGGEEAPKPPESPQG